MKNSLRGLCLLAIGAVLAVGCGGVPQEETQPQDSDSSVAIPSEYLGTEDEEAVQGEVGSSAICCNIKCSGNWYGPYPSVQYNNCAEFGRYKCKQKGLSYQNYAWKNC
ncbi:hypothetical protein [Myxococcus qinghaiensis]|uniref:hypothetical protein n=1 Tax=Myxococcus qinghaiensis TaxID=2906758 RepID=UPI0020A77287|nr:hypothetical protein [Myxococcus qinghaiensis]MCP3166636.1 hypothetical protein [Myxococcus qinghaiensis]